MSQLVYRDSLGQFSRDAVPLDDPRYNKGTDSSTLENFFSKIPQLTPIGKHYESVCLVTFYYTRTTISNHTTIQVVKSTGSVEIEVFGTEEGMNQTSEIIYSAFPNRFKAKSS